PGAARGVAADLTGTRLSLTLSEPATVTFRVRRLSAGRRILLRGRIVRKLAAGTSRLRYRGRLARRRLRPGRYTLIVPALAADGRRPLAGRRLPPGRYTLIVRARDAAGNRSSAQRVSFRIVR